MSNAIEFARGGEIASEWFFYDDARVVGQLGGAQSLDNSLKKRRWNGKIMGWSPSAAQGRSDGGKRGLILVIAADVLQLRKKMLQRSRVVDSSRLLDAIYRAPVQTLDTPLREGDSDDRHVERALLRQSVKRWKDHLVGQVARHSEQNQSVRVFYHHQASFPAEAWGATKTPVRFANSRSGPLLIFPVRPGPNSVRTKSGRADCVRRPQARFFAASPPSRCC